MEKVIAGGFEENTAEENAGDIGDNLHDATLRCGKRAVVVWRSAYFPTSPSCRNPPSQSSLCQLRTIFPSLNSWMSIAWMLNLRLVAGNPMNGPFCVPDISDRTTTLLPSATMSLILIL